MTRLLNVVMAMVFLPIAASVAEYELLLYHDQTGDASVIDNEMGVRNGNGLVKDSNENSLWITQKDGSLRIIPLPFDSNGISKDIHFRPHVLTNRQTECASLVSLHEGDGVVEYGVYAVVDRPQSENAAVVSRVVAVSPSGDQIWEAIVAGIVEGTPQINEDGSRVYVTHNSKNKGTGNYTDGKISMIRHEYGTKSGVDLEADGIFGIQDYQSPFAPLTIISNADGDLIYFGEKWNDGSASFGSIYECNGTHVRALIRTSWSTAAAPTLAEDGKSMWMVGAKSSVHGWVDAPFGGRSTWSVWLGDDDNAMTLGPLLTPDEGLIFVLTANKTVVCLDARNGDRLWSNNDEFLEPNIIQLSPDGLFLYAIGNSQGTVAQFEAKSGEIIHKFSCLDILGYDSCTAPTEGSFVISRKRNAIYFGDIYGDIVGVLIDPESDHVLAPEIKPEILVDPEENHLPQQGPGFVQESLTLLSDLLTPSAMPSFQFTAPEILSPTNERLEENPYESLSETTGILTPSQQLPQPTLSQPNPSILLRPVSMPATAWIMSPAQTPASPVYWSNASPWESYYEDNSSAPTELLDHRTNDIDEAVSSPVVAPTSAISLSAVDLVANPTTDEDPKPDTFLVAVPTSAFESLSTHEESIDLSNVLPGETFSLNGGKDTTPATSPAVAPTLEFEPVSPAEDSIDLSNLVHIDSSPLNNGVGGTAVISPVAMPTLIEGADILDESSIDLPDPLSEEDSPLNDATYGITVTSPAAMPIFVEKTNIVAEDQIDLSNPLSDETEFFWQTPNNEVDLVYFEVDLESEMNPDSQLKSQQEYKQSSSSSENGSVTIFVVSLSIGVIAIMVSGVILGRLWQQGKDEFRPAPPRDEDDYSLRAKLNL